MKGYFIVFEGTEGAGKTVQTTKLKEWLEKRGYTVVYTKEPTRSHVGLLINQILEKKIPMAEEALPLLFAADRADHTIRDVIPALKKGSVVLCDRYVFSSLAYQSAGMKVTFSKKWLKEINKYALKPDLVFFLDIDPEEGLKRIGKWQRFRDDKFFEDIEIQKRIREAYYDIFNLNVPIASFTKLKIGSPMLLSKFKALSVFDQIPIITLDGSHSIEDLQKVICETTQRFLKYKGVLTKKRQASPEFFISTLRSGENQKDLLTDFSIT